MSHRYSTFEEFLTYGLAAALAVAMLFAPNAARSGAYTNDPHEYSGPRWSNDQHHEYGLIVRPGCVALPPGAGAEYIPGRDPWGRPVIPAETPESFNNNFPVDVEIDVDLGAKYVGGRKIDLNAGHFAVGPATNELSLNRHVWQRDCFPSPK